MRSAIRSRLAGLTPGTGKCHKPFIATKAGSYLLQRCPRCGEGVPIDERIPGAAVYTMEVRAKEKS